jgi:hypothetical protein
LQRGGSEQIETGEVRKLPVSRSSSDTPEDPAGWAGIERLVAPSEAESFLFFHARMVISLLLIFILLLVQ